MFLVFFYHNSYFIYLKKKKKERTISIVKKLFCHSSMNDFRIVTTLHNLKIK